MLDSIYALIWCGVEFEPDPSANEGTLQILDLTSYFVPQTYFIGAHVVLPTGQTHSATPVPLVLEYRLPAVLAPHPPDGVLALDAHVAAWGLVVKRE